MVTEMDKIDQLMAEEQQTQTQEAEKLAVAEEEFAVTGVQLNSSSRLVTIYQRATGEPRTLPRLAAIMALNKRYRRPEHPLFGQFIFAAEPTKEYHWGESKCLLHPDNPQREQFDRWGLPICESAHLASPGEVRRHMQLRHLSAHRLIQEEETEKRRLEQLESSQALATAVLQAVSGGSLTPQQGEEATASLQEQAEQQVVEEAAEVQVAPHTHRYGRAMGAPCKAVEGCTAVRTTAYQSRKK